MTPAARVQAAIDLLDEIIAGAPAEKALTAWGRRSRFAGSKDRAAVRDHVFDVLRRRRSVLPKGQPESGRTLMLGLLSQDGAVVEVLFSGDGYGPAPLSAKEKTDLRDTDAAPDPPDVPAWIEPLLSEALGEQYAPSVAAMRQRAPVFLRVNMHKSSRERAMSLLEADGVFAKPSPLADTALIVTEGARRISNSKAFLSGVVELQDASSQAAISELPLTDGMRILDYCAGGGGKTLAMAGRVKGRFFAHDAIEARLKDLPARAKRAGIRVETRTQSQLLGEEKFDLVFCDVPCSGSGTWRRTPDAKWRFSQSDLGDLLDVQSSILKTAQHLVKTGGVLVYATCSLLLEENEKQISRFCQDNPTWRCLSQRRWSLTDGCDGFFLAQLTKGK